MPKLGLALLTGLMGWLCLSLKPSFPDPNRFALQATAATAISGTEGKDDVIAEIDHIVRSNFFAPKELNRIDWSGTVLRTRSIYRKSSTREMQAASINMMLDSLGASHTHYYTRDDPAYWQMAGIFEPVIKNDCSFASRPPLPVKVDDIGVFWLHIAAKWFVGGVYAGSPAERAGLHPGDEFLSASGNSLSPVLVFAGRQGMPTTISLRRAPSGPLERVVVVPVSIEPHQALLDATINSWKMIENNGKRIAYIHIWSWTSLVIQQAVLQAIRKSNQELADGFILDIRDGWGGASPEYLSLFDEDVPRLEAIDGKGRSTSYDAQIRKPTAILINGGTRSGKEIIAYGAKKHHLAKLVGETTAGAVEFGEPFCLTDGSLLYLAVEDAKVDGVRLEGVGVKPDVLVPSKIEYANGKDLALSTAIDLLTRVDERTNEYVGLRSEARRSRH